MAYVIEHNMAALQAYNTLNKNDKSLAKDLKKISTGMKINSAADGVSEYSIGEKMKTRLRALDQDIINVSNGDTMLEVALGGVDNIVSLLRGLKEKALNAANDSNTDEDRAIIQKEVDTSLDTIDEIANTTNYNGRLLLRGDYAGRIDSYRGIVGYDTRTVTVGPPSVTVTPGGTVIQNNKITSMTSAFSPADSNTIPISSKTSGYPSYDPKLTVQPPKIICDSMFASKIHGGTASVNIDFSGAQISGGTSVSDYKSDFDGQGFSVLCSTCYQFVNFSFNANSSVTTYEKASSSNGHKDSYIIGIQGMPSPATAQDLAKAFYDGLKSESHASLASPSTTKYELAVTGHKLYIDFDGNNYILSKDISYTDNYGMKSQQGLGIYDSGTILGNTTTTVPGTTNYSGPTTMTLYEPIYGMIEEFKGNPLKIHDGTESSQCINVYINDMRTGALGIRPFEVNPREAAQALLSRRDPVTGETINGVIDTAIEQALNEATTIGSYQQRMRIDKNNLTIVSENTTAAQSVIVDADMAAAMTAYAKDNVLSQAAQSMLAQANQNASQALSLLQEG